MGNWAGERMMIRGAKGKTQEDEGFTSDYCYIDGRRESTIEGTGMRVKGSTDDSAKTGGLRPDK